MKAHLSSCIAKSADSPVVITRKGKPVAIPLAAPDDEDELERLVLSFSPRFRELLDERAESIKREGGILHDEFWKTVEAGYHRPAEDSA